MLRRERPRCARIAGERKARRCYGWDCNAGKVLRGCLRAAGEQRGCERRREKGLHFNFRDEELW
jgi:hypothetical protein